MVFSSLILVGLLFGLFRDRFPLCNPVWSWTWGIPLALFLEGLKMGASHYSLSLFVVAYFTSNSVFVSFIGRQWNPFISMCKYVWNPLRSICWKKLMTVCLRVKPIHKCVCICEIHRKYVCLCVTSLMCVDVWNHS